MSAPRYHLRATPAELERLAKVLEAQRAKRAQQRQRSRPATQAPSLTCPRCGRRTWHPEDIRQGYCGNCHDWTSPPEHERQDPTP